MFNRRVILVCMASAFGAASSGCTITNCDEGAICLGDDKDSASHRCVALCQHFVDCGRIDRDQRGACIDACLDGFEHDEDTLEEYYECSAENTCRELSRECGRPPFTLPTEEEEEENDPEPVADAGTAPDSGAQTETDAGTAPGAEPDASAVLDAGTDAQPASGNCSCDEDCAGSEGCLEGTCYARCTASCECRLGDVCESGLCVTPAPVSMSCETDCDCPAGDQCVASVCTAEVTTPQ